MVRKFVVLMLSLCLILTTPLVVAAASTEKSIQLYLNNVKIAGVHPILNSGVMYVPYRQFFSAMGYKVSFDPDTRKIAGVIRGAEIEFWAGEDTIYYDGVTYYLDKEIPVLNGQVYLPLRLVSNLAKYSVSYDQSKLSVSLKPFGDGQEAAIKELLTKYYETYSPRLLTSDNLKLGYLNLEYDYEANQPISEIAVRDYKVTIGRIEYTSASEANLQVTYIKNTEELDREDVYVFDIRYERGQWKIANDGWIYNRMDLPEDIDKKAAAIKENRNSEQKSVLADLRTYYNAYNSEDLDLTTQYTDPLIIKEWNAVVFSSVTWDSMMKGHFAHSESKYKLLDERVVYLGDKEAVVQGKLDWSDVTYNDGADNHKYEALIYLKYVNGHWTYNNDISLDQDFDERSNSKLN
ncbi:copper amine oxidase N-terminal domain-containing protein [Paenibacillus sp.]|uniref:copper amine oxidase N-terminal domain-containing protein n=1 Tax=Paenibacillus sp. TaxID=58172 RepID=UPI0028B202D6|nr:copper amine oxidase N-terminal domain-containing protein [Paenibacillus sp.]